MHVHENAPFVVVDLEQGTTAWRAWRRNGIGASEAPIIMGENPFETYEELLEKKRGAMQEGVKSTQMLNGIALEEEARQHYITTSGNEVRPACVQSTRYDWLRASLDGLNAGRTCVIEIKCGEKNYLDVECLKDVPELHYGQTQHILAVTGFAVLDYWCYRPDRSPILIRVPRDDEYIERLLEEEQAFWKRVTQSTSE